MRTFFSLPSPKSSSQMVYFSIFIEIEIWCNFFHSQFSWVSTFKFVDFKREKNETWKMPLISIQLFNLIEPRLNNNSRTQKEKNRLVFEKVLWKSLITLRKTLSRLVKYLLIIKVSRQQRKSWATRMKYFGNRCERWKVQQISDFSETWNIFLRKSNVYDIFRRIERRK